MKDVEDLTNAYRSSKCVSSNLYGFLPKIDKGILNVTADYGAEMYSTSSTSTVGRLIFEEIKLYRLSKHDISWTNFQG